jgi:hypothetical protein
LVARSSRRPGIQQRNTKRDLWNGAPGPAAPTDRGHDAAHAESGRTTKKAAAGEGKFHGNAARNASRTPLQGILRASLRGPDTGRNGSC